MDGDEVAHGAQARSALALRCFPRPTPLAAAVRDHDWDASLLGPLAGWPPALRAATAQVMESPVPMWLAWGEPLALVYNEAYAPILGNKHPWATGAPLQQVWQEVWGEVGHLVAATLHGEPVYCEDLPLVVNRDGQARDAWFTFWYAPLRDEDGQVRGLACTVWDTTDKMLAARRLAVSQATNQALVQATRQLQAHSELQAAEAEAERARQQELADRYRLAVLATNDAVWDWRLADGHVVWNQALATLFGHHLKATSAQWWLDHIHPDDRQRIEAEVHAVLDGTGSSWTGEYRFLCADGRHADILDRGYVLRDEQGRAVRLIGAMLDLTSRNAAEAALRDSERRYQTLFDRIDEGFCIIEFLDGPRGPLSDYLHIAANPAFLANAGIADVVGRTVRELVPDEAEAWVATYRRVLESGEPLRFERELAMTGRRLELAAFRVDPPLLRQVAVLFKDVTQRHRAELALRELNDTLERRVQAEVAGRMRTEAALRQSQKMEAVGQLTGGIAHDFNNMLSVVLSSLDLLDRRFLADQPAARRYLDASRNGARRAAQLTQRLLAFARQQPLRPVAVDANQLVAGMADLLRHSLGAAVRFDMVLADGLWPLHADPNQLENAILNLAVNGRDAMDDLAGEARLVIATANCHVDARDAADHPGLQAGPYVTIAVTDSGCGMAPEVAAQAFDPFFTTKEVGRGTGLGLSQVHGFVNQSGGHVRIASEPGRGTTVTLYLPRLVGAPVQAEARVAATPAPRAAGRELVLIVEDEALVRQLAVEALQELGYRVLEADGAEAALALLDRHAGVALLFTDIVMPGVNGRRLADEVRRRHPSLKLLFTTGYTRHVVVHDAGLDPGVPLLVKPYSLDDLAARVREALDGRG